MEWSHSHHSNGSHWTTELYTDSIEVLSSVGLVCYDVKSQPKSSRGTESLMGGNGNNEATDK